MPGNTDGDLKAREGGNSHDKKAESGHGMSSTSSFSSPSVRFDRVQQRVSVLLEQMQKDNPTDPMNYLSRAFSREHLEEDEETPIRERYPDELRHVPLSIIVLGASGDLAKKKTFPALFTLFRNGMLPPGTSIIGYARSKLSRDDVRERIQPHLAQNASEREKKGFFDMISYVAGKYDSPEDMKELDKHLGDIEKKRVDSCTACDQHAKGTANRLFYLAIPPTAFVDSCTSIKKSATASGDGWTRIVVEKPFGHDTGSSRKLAEDLQALFHEQQLYRIDHYLGKEMVQNLTTLRFANHVFGALWNNHHVSNVQITFKEAIGTQGRGGYFDKFGIIRDVMQNHLTQILALIVMEKPKTLDGEAIRDEKVAALRCVKPIEAGDCVLGQYTRSPDGDEPGYLEDEGVPNDSRTPTFASALLHVHNDRWEGVPFVMKAGKALDRKEVVIRIQFKDEILPFKDRTQRNELVIRAQPDEAMYLKVANKAPGIGQGDVLMSELDLTYKERFEDVRLPEAYESLINEAICGNPTNFVRSDELDAAWQIFTPLLHKIDEGELKPTPYPAGSRGPAAADDLAQRAGYVRTTNYAWQPKTPRRT